MPDTKPTRDQFLLTARKLFAERGFYGVSLAAVSNELGLTKQALLHHFGSKEKLYGHVLEGISIRFMATLTAESDTLDQALRRLFDHMMHEREDARIVMRELLDNTERAARSQKWYLRPFLDHLVMLGQQRPDWSELTEPDVFARIYQLVGAVNYWAISGPTLDRMYGTDRLADYEAAFPETLLAQLGSPHAPFRSC